MGVEREEDSKATQLGCLHSVGCYTDCISINTAAQILLQGWRGISLTGLCMSVHPSIFQTGGQGFVDHHQLFAAHMMDCWNSIHPLSALMSESSTS